MDIYDVLKLGDFGSPNKSIRSETLNYYSNIKKRMYDICNSLNQESKSWSPKKTISIINNYLKDPSTINRILYSEINSYYIGLSAQDRGKFSTNAENLLLFVLENNPKNNELKRIVLKIYDHIQLVNSQTYNSSENFKDNMAKGYD